MNLFENHRQQITASEAPSPIAYVRATSMNLSDKNISSDKEDCQAGERLARIRDHVFSKLTIIH
jgi:hypothetical protein